MGSSLKTQDDTSPSSAALAPFRRFDRSIQAAAARVPADEAEAARLLRALIDDLPQRDAIDDRHADRWLARTIKGTVERFQMSGEEVSVASVYKHVLWHVRRASGFGGSEIGTVLAGARGEKGTFTDIRTLVMEKLLMLAPQPGTIEMTRGIRAEPWLAKILHEQRRCERRDDLLLQLRDFRWDKRPCLIGTPDDTLQVPATAYKDLPEGGGPHGRVQGDVCADYETNGVSSDYVGQVHHYLILAMAAGVEIDEMAIMVHDPRSFMITPYPVAYDKDLAKSIMSAAGVFWDEFVMKGELPEKIVAPQLMLEDEAVIDLGYTLGAFKVIEAEVQSRISETQERISLLGGNWHGLSTGPMELDIATFRRARSWKEAELVEIAKAADVDPERFRTRSDKIDAKAAARLIEDLKGCRDDQGAVLDLVARTLDGRLCNESKLDTQALADHLEELGVSVLPAMAVKESFLLTRKKAGAGVERLSELKDNVADLVEAMETAVREQIPAIRGRDVEQPVEADAEELAAEYDAMAM